MLRRATLLPSLAEATACLSQPPRIRNGLALAWRAVRVRCLQNDLARLVRNDAVDRAIAAVYPRRDEPFDLKLGREYIVFAIAHQFDLDWFYVFDDPSDEYPRWFPTALFEVLDPTRPPDWLVLDAPRPDGLREAPRVWANTPHFYERLVDGDPDVLVAFRAVKLALEADDRRGR